MKPRIRMFTHIRPDMEFIEGETIENKVRRIVESKEPISDSAPMIYTNRKDGVIAAYNIRTDRWEIAQNAMDKVNAAKSNSYWKPKDVEKRIEKETGTHVANQSETNERAGSLDGVA